MSINRRQFMGALAAGAAAPLLAEKTDSGTAAGTVSYARGLKIDYDVDVFVAGGGPAGIAAAVAAARAGKRVFLAESSGAFGGAATAALVPAFATFSDGAKRVVGGIGWEVRRLVSKDIAEDAYWTPLNPEELKRTYDALVSAAGVQFSFFTNLCDAVAKDGRISHVVLSSKRGLFAVRARIFIDCTGDGDLIAFAGGKFEKGDEDGSVMPATLCSLWANIDFDHLTGGWAQQKLPQAIKDGVFTVPDLHLPGFFRASGMKGVGGGNIGHAFNVDPTDERSLTHAMIDSRKRLPEYERFYKNYLGGYEKMDLVATAPYLGVRESRRVTCDYALTVKDFVARAQFTDQIGRYCYPVDVHNSKPGDKKAMEAFLKEYEKDLRYKKGESYGIPYRSLIPVSFSNALVAGRCIGTDRKMQASIRVMPGSFITGQAAGTAAALACASGSVRSVAAETLRSALASADVVL